MKRIVFIALALVVFLTACNYKAFVKKLVGTWKLNTYLFDGLNKTLYFDTTYRNYQLQINEDPQTYLETWQEYSFAADSLIVADTLGYDSVNMVYIIQIDTLRWNDTTVTPFLSTGMWELINSEEDLQLRDDSSNDVRIERILELTKNDLKLRKGNEEFYLKKQ